MISQKTDNQKTKREYKVVGTRPIRHDGVDKVTGRAMTYPISAGKMARSRRNANTPRTRMHMCQVAMVGTYYSACHSHFTC